MNVGGLRLAPQSAFKKFLGRDILTAVQFNYAAIIERVCVTRQSHICSQT
jgi:hypothetical protein